MSFQGLKCFAVYDVKVKAFLTPFFFAHCFGGLSGHA